MSGENRRPPRRVACPGCGAPSEFSPANPWRPFCSERCRLVDLGAWAAEAYRIPLRGPSPGGESDESGEDGAPGPNTPGQ